MHALLRHRLLCVWLLLGFGYWAANATGYRGEWSFEQTLVFACCLGAVSACLRWKLRTKRIGLRASLKFKEIALADLADLYWFLGLALSGAAFYDGSPAIISLGILFGSSLDEQRWLFTTLTRRPSEKSGRPSNSNLLQGRTTSPTSGDPADSADAEFHGPHEPQIAPLRESTQELDPDGTPIQLGVIRLLGSPDGMHEEISVLFSPPFDVIPEVEMECDHEHLQVKLLRKTELGMRLSVSGKGGEGTAELHWYAKA